MKYLAITFSLLTFYSCNSYNVNNNEYLWFTEAYEYRGTYDTTKYTFAQIEGIYKLCNGHFGYFEKIGVNDREGVIDLTDIRNKNEADILKNYNDEKNELENLEIIDSDFWKERKIKKLKELADKYELQLITIKAYSDPQVLKDNRFSNLCHLYVDIANLIDTTELLDHWQDIFKKRDYGSTYMRHFNDKYKTASEHFLNARADIITFGYWHCTSRKLAELNDEKATEEFKKLFTNIRQKRWY